MVGPPDTPYAEGYYHGKLIFPSDYPMNPPEIYMMTPSGRFEVNTTLCLSISSYHPEHWSPMWTIATIVRGLLFIISYLLDKC